MATISRAGASPVVSGGGVQGRMTWTNIQGEALCVHISEVLTDLQPVALP